MTSNGPLEEGRTRAKRVANIGYKIERRSDTSTEFVAELLWSTF